MELKKRIERIEERLGKEKKLTLPMLFELLDSERLFDIDIDKIPIKLKRLIVELLLGESENDRQSKKK